MTHTKFDTTRRLWTALLLASLCALAGCPDTGAPAAPAVITITYPESGSIVSERRITVKGTAENTREVTIAGEKVSVVSGVWSALVEFDEGEVTAVAEAGAGKDSVTFLVDATAPRLAITSPERGAYVATNGENRVTVTGTVEENLSGLSLVKINERIVQPDDQGAFSGELPVKFGYNQFNVTAIDKAGHETQHTMALMYGDTVDPTSLIDPGFDFVVGPDAINTATRVISDVATPAFVKNFLDTTLMIENVTVDAVDFDPLEVTITPRSNELNPGEPGHLEFELGVTNLKLLATFMFGGEAIQLEISVPDATVRTTAELGVDGNSGLEIQFGQSELELGPEGIDWKISTGDGTLDSEDVKFLEQTVEKIAYTAFSEVLSEQLIDQLYDPDILKRKVTILGRELAFEIQLQEIIVNASGIFAETALKLPAAAAPDVRVVPGALAMPVGAPEATTLDTDTTATTNHATLNRLMHGVWRSGLLHLQLVGGDFAGFMLPFELTSGALALAIDGRVANHSTGDSPAAIVLRPALPPFVALDPDSSGGTDGALKARMGELHMDIILDATSGAPKKLLTLALFIDLDLSVRIDDANQLSIGFEPVVAVDLIDEPLFDLDDATAESLLLELARLIPDFLEQNIQLGGEADFLWFRATAPRLEVHGLEKDQLSVGFDLTAVPAEQPTTP